MCTVCGCSQGEPTIETADQAAPGRQGHSGHDPAGGHDHGRDHAHDHLHDHGRAHTHAHDHAHDHEHEHAGGSSEAGRRIALERDILARNDSLAAANRAWFGAHGVLALNLVSSPGSGKTTLLTRTIEALKPEFGLAVLEGDQQTSLDAERIRATGVPALQINTGKGCHLDAHMVGHALARLGPADGSVLFIENVGNLVCPAAFDLGEAAKVAILSVTEGDDKPLKYPDMFSAAQLVLIHKTDLLPYVDFDVQRCIDNARRVHPGIQVLQLSSRSGEGLDTWCEWVRLARRSRMLGWTAG